MNAPNAILKTSLSSAAAVPRLRPNPARLRKPYPLPLRPLIPDRFRPPRGEKQVFLPNFTLALLRTPLQPAHFASFLTPLWLNKLDLKDYLYNLYSVRVLRVRSYIMQGKVVRMRNGRLRRERQEKKMTVEMETGKGGFVWPDEEWSEEGKEEEREKMKRVEEERRRERGEERKGEREGEGSLRERKRALLGGRVRWRSSWVEDGGEAARAMGRV